MKKGFLLFLAAMICVCLAACGGGADEPSGNVADIGGEGAGLSTQQPEQSLPGEGSSGDAAGPDVGMKNDRVVSTDDDGMGNTTITEYIYKDGALSEIVMTVECADAATAKKLLESYTTGELKNYGSELYADIKQDGNSVMMKFKESYLAAFSGMTMEQLADLLEGGVPVDGSGVGDAVGSDDAADSPGGAVKINTAWDDMTLPDGFPKLADGATNYSNMDSLITVSWNVMSQNDAEEMVGKLEDWTGVSAEKTEMDGTIGWHMDNGICTADLNYYADTFGGMMDQVMLSIMIFE